MRKASFRLSLTTPRIEQAYSSKQKINYLQQKKDPLSTNFSLVFGRKEP